MNLGIVDYGMGNLRSLENALISLGIKSTITSKASDLKNFSHVIIPGVGSFQLAMQNLNKSGMADAIKEHVKTGKPLMGICLGMQLLATSGSEPEKIDGLNFISGEVIRMDEKENFRIPHVGWNSLIQNARSHYLFKGTKPEADVYFVHSYHFKTTPENTLAYTDHSQRFSSIVEKDAVLGMQFHPEKSQKLGLKMLKNYFEHYS